MGWQAWHAAPTQPHVRERTGRIWGRPADDRAAKVIALVLPGAVATVGLRELRQDASDLVRRVEAGEEITVAGRLSARLVAAESQSWRSFPAIAQLFDGLEDAEWETDRGLVDQALRDPSTVA